MKKIILVTLACFVISFSSLIVETAAATGDYSYIGMGRIALEKNMVNNVNTLTQDMFYKGEAGNRIPNTNTIFIIQYDFVLAEDITIPDRCVLKFDGGSISGAYTLTGTNTGINAELIRIFGADATLAGSWNVAESYPEWFDGTEDYQRITKAISISNTIKLRGTYTINEEISEIKKTISIIGDGTATIKNNTGGAKTDYIIRITNASDVVIEGVVFDSLNKSRGNVQFNRCNNVIVRNCVFTNYSYEYGWYKTDSQLIFEGGSNIVVETCKFKQNGWNNGTPLPTKKLNRCISAHTTKTFKCINNEFCQVNQAVVIGGGSFDTLINNNSFDGVTDNCLYFFGSDVICTNNTINNGEEVFVIGGDCVIISNNYCKNTTNKFVRINGNTNNLSITNNTIYTNVDDIGCSLCTYTNEAIVENIVISGNTLNYGTHYSISATIFVKISAVCIISDNIIIGTLKGATANGVFRIRGTFDKMDIHNNFIENKGEYNNSIYPLYLLCTPNNPGDDRLTMFCQSDNLFKNLRQSYTPDTSGISAVFNNNNTFWKSGARLFASSFVPNIIPANGSFCFNTGGNSPFGWKVVNGAWVAVYVVQ